MAKIDDLKAQAALIENETAIGGNTAKRVGGAIGTAAELIDQQITTLDASVGKVATIDEKVKELQAENAKHEDEYQLVSDTISSLPIGEITLVREDSRYVNAGGGFTNGQGYYFSNVYTVKGATRLLISTPVKNNTYVKIWAAVKNGVTVKSGSLTTVTQTDIVDVSQIEFDEIYVSCEKANKNTIVEQKPQLLATFDDVVNLKKQVVGENEPNTLFRELNFNFVQDKNDLLPVLTEVGFIRYNGEVYNSEEWRNGMLALASNAKRVYLDSRKSAVNAVWGYFVDADGEKMRFFDNARFPLYTDIPNGAVGMYVSLKKNVDDVLFYVLDKDVINDILNRFAQNESDISSLNSAIGSDVKIIAPSIFYAVVGNEFNIYYDTIVKGFDDGLNSPSNIYVNISCPDLGATKGVAAMRDRYWHIDGSKLNNTHIGDHTFVIRVFNVAGKEIDAKWCVLRVVSNTGLTKTTNILCIGDSLTNNGPIVATMGEGFESIGGTKPTFIGQRTTYGYKHEGYPGYTFASFSIDKSNEKYHMFQIPIGTNVIVGDKYSSNGNTYEVVDIRIENVATTSLRCYVLSGTSTPTFTGTLTKISGASTSAETIEYSGYEYQNGNPFWNAKTSSVDLADYRKRMGMGSAKFDVVVIMLGVNESVGAVKNMSFAVSDAKKLITAILNDAGTYSTKVILQLTPADASTPSSWQTYRDETGYSKKIGYWANYWSLRALLEEEFTKKEYAGKVYIGQATLGVDRYYGYGMSSVTPAKRVSEGFSSLREDYHTNSVHPSTVGYKQFGDGYFLQALGLIKEQ